MSKPQLGKRYLYRNLFGRVYHVDILRVGLFFSLCRYRVDNVDFGYSYEKAALKPNWRIMEDL